MDSSIIETVLSVYRTKSYFETSYQLSLSISSVSKHISSLEQSLGVRIFSRASKNKSVRLTEEGNTLIPLIEKINDAFSALNNKAALIRNERDSQLAIGYVPLIGTIGEDEIITNFLVQYPNVLLRQITGTRNSLLAQLRGDLIDGFFLIIEDSPDANEDLSALLDMREYGLLVTYKSPDLLICVSKKHPLARRVTIRSEDLYGETLIFNQSLLEYGLPKGAQGILNLSSDRLKKRFMDYKKPRVVLDSVANLGGILPLTCGIMLQHDGVEYLKLEGWNITTYGVFVYRKSLITKALSQFKGCAEAYAQGQRLKHTV